MESRHYKPGQSCLEQAAILVVAGVLPLASVIGVIALSEVRATQPPPPITPMPTPTATPFAPMDLAYRHEPLRALQEQVEAACPEGVDPRHLLGVLQDSQGVLIRVYDGIAPTCR